MMSRWMEGVYDLTYERTSLMNLYSEWIYWTTWDSELDIYYIFSLASYSYLLPDFICHSDRNQS